jgi:hypothetical protein
MRQKYEAKIGGYEAIIGQYEAKIGQYEAKTKYLLRESLKIVFSVFSTCDIIVCGRLLGYGGEGDPVGVVRQVQQDHCTHQPPPDKIRKSL